ncbi:MAG: DUF3592 domain-containing protein [Betaproteobacteria bacterium]|nr:DUF3592 domain-containing protein [Betaproteobacteria bacterium]
MAFILPLVLVAVGVAVILYATKVQRDGERTRRSRVVQGIVLESGLLDRMARDADATVEHRVHVRCGYKVGGREYEGTRVALGPSRVFHDHAAAEARYRVDGQIMVRYDPDDPESAVLEAGAQNVLFLYAIGGAFVAVSLMLLMGALR